jgi:Fe2+ transport system protein B
VIRERTSSEGDRIKKQIAQIDKQKLKQQLGSAVGALSSIALKPLRDLQMAEKLNALNLDMEDAENQKQIDQHMRNLQEQEELEEMMRIKKEAEERTLTLTRQHLLDFLKENPDASYNEWIEDLHPEK